FLSIWLPAAVAMSGLLRVHPARAEDQAARPPTASPAHQLTMAAAIEAALSHNLQLAIEAENIVVAESKTAADEKLRLPLVGAKGNGLWGDKPIVVARSA